MDELDLRQSDTTYVTRGTRSLPSARMLIGVSMIIFTVLSVFVIIAGRLPVTPTPQPIEGLTYDQVKIRDDAILTTYGWVDQSAGVVRIPIDEAIRLTAERGLPVRDQAQNPGVEGQMDQNGGSPNVQP